jgi:hypothetical protein
LLPSFLNQHNNQLLPCGVLIIRPAVIGSSDGTPLLSPHLALGWREGELSRWLECGPRYRAKPAPPGGAGGALISQVDSIVVC